MYEDWNIYATNTFQKKFFAYKLFEMYYLYKKCFFYKMTNRFYYKTFS